MKSSIIILISLIVSISALGVEMLQEHIELTPTNSIAKASFDCLKPKSPDAVLILLPGANGDGRGFLEERAWTRFAVKQNWAVVAATFVSPIDELKRNRGYYDATAGSGMMLRTALDRMDLLTKPLYLYGFSGGGKFAVRFADAYPKSVAAFAVLGFGGIAWDAVKNGPCGIIACGEEDPRVGAAFSWFKDARALGRRLSWVEVPELGHVRSVSVEEFVRQWFVDESKRQANVDCGVVCEIGSGSVGMGRDGVSANCSWFPSDRICESWRSRFWACNNAIADGLNKMAEVESRKCVSNGIPVKVLCREFKTKFKKCPKMTLHARIPERHHIKGVICLSLLANNVEDIVALLKGFNREGVVGEWLRYAERNDLAVFAWGAPRGLWRPRYNWDEMDRKERRGLGRSFHAVAIEWKITADFIAREHSLPFARCLMVGFSGAGQFAQRLALHLPDKFAAVAVHVPSSFDYPVPEGREIVWCLTTGENEGGYARSLKFVKAAKASGYPIVYKAYPGLGHADSMSACKLGQAVFDYVLYEGNGNALDADKWPFVADYVNQRTARRHEDAGIQDEFSICLPTAEVERLWKRE